MPTSTGSDAVSADRVGVLLFDLLETYRRGIEEAAVLDRLVDFVAGCRERGIPLFYARADHRADGADFATCLTDTDRSFQPWSDGNPQPTRPAHGSGSPELSVVRELAPQPGDYDIPKHRWNAFYGTCLELSLRSRGIDTLVVAGGSTHVGIASTVYYGRDADFDMIVVRDGCTGFREQREFFLDKVFPRVCRVRTCAEVLGMVDAALVTQD